jgi:hypothetical protein
VEGADAEDTDDTDNDRDRDDDDDDDDDNDDGADDDDDDENDAVERDRFACGEGADEPELSSAFTSSPYFVSFTCCLLSRVRLLVDCDGCSRFARAPGLSFNE